MSTSTPSHLSRFGIERRRQMLLQSLKALRILLLLVLCLQFPLQAMLHGSPGAAILGRPNSVHAQTILKGSLHLVHIQQGTGVFTRQNLGGGTFNNTCAIQATAMGNIGDLVAAENTALIDADGDGLLDIVFGLDNGPQEIRFHKGDGLGGFNTTAVATTPTRPAGWGTHMAGNVAASSTFVVDVTGDGVPDWVSSLENAGADTGIAVWAGLGDGTFATTPTQSTGLTTPTGWGGHFTGVSEDESTFLADVTGDGIRDWVTGLDNVGVDSGIAVWPGLGGGLFSTTPIVTTGLTSPTGWVGHFAGTGISEETFLVDVTGDGIPDWVASHDGLGADSGIAVWPGLGGGQFGATPVVTTGLTTPANWGGSFTGVDGAESAFVMDVTGDGVADWIAVVDNVGSDSGIAVWPGLGGGTFATTPTTTINFTGGPLRAGTNNLQVTFLADIFAPGATVDDACVVTPDTTPPDAPTVTGPAADSATNDNTPTLLGVAEPESTVTVKDDQGNVLCTAQADPITGEWSCEPATPLADGPQTLQVTATDPAGNESDPTAHPFTVDTTPPAAPVITGPAAGSTTDDNTPTITGTAEPGSTVTVSEGGNPICTAQADPVTGAWSCEPTTPLADGPHTITATATDALGNESAPATQPFTVDTTAPASPTITGPAADSTTDDDTPIITGTAEPGSTVTVTEDGNPVCTAQADPVTGAWSCEPTTPLADGPHTITATATDPAGNESAPTTQSFTVDTTPPDAPVITSPAAGSTTDDNTPTITGTAEPGSTVTVSEGGNPICTAQADPVTGAWSCEPATPLADGPHTITATATDPAGNESGPSPARTFTVDTTVPGDTTPPEPPVITSPAAGSTTGDNTPTISGLAEPGSTVTVSEGGQELCTALADPVTGIWSCEPATPLADGPHTITAVATDAAGNESEPATQPFTVDTSVPSDTTPPEPPVITSPAAGSTVDDDTPAISGLAEPGSTVTVSEGGQVICTAQADPVTGIWSCEPTTPLAQGPHTLTVTATDLAGNQSEPTTHPFTVGTPPPTDTTPPDAPVITSPAVGSTTGDDTPTISGLAEPGSTVTVSEGGEVLCTATADPVTGLWSCEPSTPLADGPHTITATATDPAGNQSQPTTQSFTVDISIPADTTPPAPPTITTPAYDSIIDDTLPTISGFAEPGSTVTVSEGGNLICIAQADPVSGAWSCVPTTPLDEGAHSIQATATDGAGNQSAVTDHRFVIELDTPALPPSMIWLPIVSDQRS
jgi:large repetitive protein